jgi:hypothetical protein
MSAPASCEHGIRRLGQYLVEMPRSAFELTLGQRYSTATFRSSTAGMLRSAPADLDGAFFRSRLYSGGGVSSFCGCGEG